MIIQLSNELMIHWIKKILVQIKNFQILLIIKKIKNWIIIM